MSDSGEASGLLWVDGGSGEINTMTNVGTGGVGVFKAKVGVQFQMKKINAGSSKVTITDDTGNDEIDIDVTEANLSLNNVGGTLSIGKGGTGQATATLAFDALSPSTTKGDLIVNDGTHDVRLAVGTNGYALVAASGATEGVVWALVGDVLKPATSADMSVPRWDGTDGAQLDDSGVIIGDLDELFNYRAKRVAYTADHTMDAADRGKLVVLDSTTNKTFTLPANAEVGTAYTFYAKNTGRALFVAASGALIVHPDNHTGTRTRYSTVFAFCEENSGGSAAVWTLGGDTDF